MPTKKISKNFETAKKESLKDEYPVYKPDPILLMRDNMLLTQMRFFEAYLSKIDANDPSTYRVRIGLNKVAELANIDLSNRKAVKKMCEDIENTRFNFKRYRERYETETIDPNTKVHRDTFPLFDRFMLNETIDGEYFIEVIPGVTMSEMLQKYQKNYATYKLQEVYKLSNKTNMRMYSCFKKLQTLNTTKISIELLKGYLGLENEQYKRATDFRKYVVEPGVEEINAVTDITVTYKPYKKGRSIAGWSFTIKPKEQEIRKIEEKTIKSKSTDDANFRELTDEEIQHKLAINLFRETIGGGSEFTDTEINLMREVVRDCSFAVHLINDEFVSPDMLDIELQGYIRRQYAHSLANYKTSLKGYFIGALTEDYAKYWQETKEQVKKEKQRSNQESSYDVEEAFKANLEYYNK